MYDVGPALNKLWVNGQYLLDVSIGSYPRKHETFTRCWYNAGPASATSGECLVFAGYGIREHRWSWVQSDRGACPRLNSRFWAVSVALHSAISECHSHPLRFCVACTHIQHHGSLSSVTSPSANQQPAVHKWATSGEVDRDWPVVFKCTPAHPLPTHGNLCTQCSSYKPEGIYECSTFNFIFIDN